MQPPSRPYSLITGLAIEPEPFPCLIRDVRILREEFKAQGMKHEEAHEKALQIISKRRHDLQKPKTVGDGRELMEALGRANIRQSGPQADLRHFIDDNSPLDKTDDARRECESFNWGNSNV
jgi:hypothetical protein